MTLSKSESLARLIYRSRSKLQGSASDIAREFGAILETSRRRNGDHDVTGALMFTSHLFIQALEGPALAVELTFDRICCDLRHEDVEVIEYVMIAERSFGNWSMNNLEPNSQTQALLSQSASPSEITEAAVRTLRMMSHLLAGDAPDTLARLSA